MANLNKEELAKLPLVERINKLKEMEEERKKEMSDIHKLIESTQNQLKSDEIAKKISPSIREVNITTLFGKEGGENLESSVRRELSPKAAVREPEAQNIYFSMAEAVEVYNNLKDLAYASIEGNLSNKHVQMIDQIGEKLDNTKYQSASREVANVLVASMAALYKIRKYAGLEKQNY